MNVEFKFGLGDKVAKGSVPGYRVIAIHHSEKDTTYGLVDASGLYCGCFSADVLSPDHLQNCNAECPIRRQRGSAARMAATLAGLPQARRSASGA